MITIVRPSDGRDVILTYHCNRRLWGSGENDCWKQEASRKENLLEGLGVALMQQKREGFEFDAIPQKLACQAASELNINHTIVFCNLCREKYHPFKPIRDLELNEEDPDRRMDTLWLMLQL